MSDQYTIKKKKPAPKSYSVPKETYTSLWISWRIVESHDVEIFYISPLETMIGFVSNNKLSIQSIEEQHQGKLVFWMRLPTVGIKIFRFLSEIQFFYTTKKSPDFLILYNFEDQIAERVYSSGTEFGYKNIIPLMASKYILGILSENLGVQIIKLRKTGKDYQVTVLPDSKELYIDRHSLLAGFTPSEEYVWVLDISKNYSTQNFMQKMSFFQVKKKFQEKTAKEFFFPEFLWKGSSPVWTQEIIDVVISPDERICLAITKDHKIVIMDFEKKTFFGYIDQNSESQTSDSFLANIKHLKLGRIHVGFDHSSKYLTASDPYGNIAIFDFENTKTLKQEVDIIGERK